MTSSLLQYELTVSRIEDVQWCTITQHYAALNKDSFSTKSVNFFYVRAAIANSTFFLDKDSGRITLRGESRLIIENKTPSFLSSPRLVISAPPKPDTSVGYSERNTQDWSRGVRDKVFETYVRLFGVL